MMRWLAWLRGVDLPPWGRGLPPIAVEFYECAKCGSLLGGILGKGPTKRWRAEGAARCRHRWSALSAEAFRAEASARFGVDWSRESELWSRLG